MLRDESVEMGASWCETVTGVTGVAARSATIGVGAEAVRGLDAHAAKCAGLHRRLKRIVRARGALDTQEAAALREAEALRLWRHYGYSSLLEYMEMEMGYSPRMALERLRVAKAIVELPVIAEAMTQGDLSFSAARELTRVATEGTEQVWLEAITDKNLRQVEALVSGHEKGDKPSDPVDPKRRKRRLRYDDVEQETFALLRQAREILERECGERLGDDAFLRMVGRMVIDGAASPERRRAPYQIAVSTCEQCKRAWQDGGGITVEMSPAAIAVAMCDAQHIGSVEAPPTGCVDAQRIGANGERHIAALDEQHSGRTDDRHIAAIDERHVGAIGGRHIDCADRDVPMDNAGRSASSTSGVASNRTQARSSIPPALRRRVRARDHGTCRVPWCRSSRNIDQHHIEPVCNGGKHTFENLITLCESHHLALHEGTLVIEGTASNPRFERRVHSSLAVAAHAVDTARALKDLGFDGHEVSAAMEKTRAHVGTAALTLEQWIKIALGYCPKPRA